MIKIARKLANEVDSLSFSLPVTHVYNPLRYAWESHQLYLQKYGQKKQRILLVGMNPGPFGMAQTGVPFGEISFVRDWMGVVAPVLQPNIVHPKRPVDGFDCSRSEVSGRRLWGWAKQRYQTAENFFTRFFVHNYCPLVFMEQSGRNRTPNNLKSAEKKILFQICDTALKAVIHELHPTRIIGVGQFAEQRAKSCTSTVSVGRVLHPSPASPAANRGWAAQAEKQLQAMGVEL